MARCILISLAVATALLSACAPTTTRPTLDPKEEKEASFHYQLGANFFAEKMVPQALRELLITLEIDPNHPDALHLLGFVYQGRHDFGQAIIYYKRAVKARDNFYIAQNNLGTALMAAGRYGEAAELFEALSAKPMYNTPELAYNNLGWSYFKLGDHLRAEESIKMALFLQPELCVAHNNLGVVMESRGDRVGARRAWEKAVRKCPYYAEPHFHVGMMLHTRRDPKAATWFRRCYEVAPESNWGDRCRSYLEIYPQ